MAISGGRSKAFRKLQRLIGIADEADRTGMPSKEAVELVREHERAAFSRRKFLGGAAAAGALALTSRKAFAAPNKPNPDVGIVGAGLAGLQCAYTLSTYGVTASLYEASSRVGGRQKSLRGFFPGQVAELGGELVDTGHKMMLGWINKLNLTREDLRDPADDFWYIDGQLVPEATVVDQYRAFVASMRADLQACSGAPTVDGFNAADVALDRTSLHDYLVSRGAGNIARKAIEAAYVGEYGRECTEQSCFNFLLYIHADKRSKFTPFGVFSDERFHVVEGQDRIASGIAAALPRQPEFGLTLVRVAKTSGGRIELTFKKGNTTVVKTHDHAVLAIPFTVLRNVQLDASLQLPAWKTQAINQLGYGDNAKLMVGFKGPFWLDVGCNGTAYANLPNLQGTWETNPSLATTEHAIMTDYTGGVLGKNMSSNVQNETAKFLADLEKIFPGATAKAMKSGNSYKAVLEHWPSNPLALGSYTCYLPGQFTTIAGNESKPIGNLMFAGEHANSFYVWQGFQEGALTSGYDTAIELLA
ncbi:MAG TPA: FAD-dependent oxidoreductase [Kofleriaceae bacterium]|nr:FAD-dependent oxidoreductase [Kofleriaceae bacterium]